MKLLLQLIKCLLYQRPIASLKRAWETVLVFTTLFGIVWCKLGTVSSIVFLPIQPTIWPEIIYGRLASSMYWIFCHFNHCLGFLRYLLPPIWSPTQGLEGSVFWAKSHLICRAQPKVSRLCMSGPPHSSGYWTVSHETRQFPPFTCSWPFHWKLLRFLSIALITHLGRSVEIALWMTGSQNHGFMISRPPLFINEAFQPGRWYEILSISGKKHPWSASW